MDNFFKNIQKGKGMANLLVLFAAGIIIGALIYFLLKGLN